MFQRLTQRHQHCDSGFKAGRREVKQAKGNLGIYGAVSGKDMALDDTDSRREVVAR